MIIGLDFDGTCVDMDFPRIGKEAPGCVEVIKGWLAKGDCVVLWTCRHGGLLEEAVAWMCERDIEPSYVNQSPHHGDTPRKVAADIYVDDKNAGCPLVLPPGFHGPVVDWPAVAALVRARRTA